SKPLYMLCQTCHEVNHFLLTYCRFAQQRDTLRCTLFTDGRQPLTKKSLLGRPKNKTAPLAYVAVTGRF
ncbi:hypothetical protein DFH07DRAFT_723641, partial [Mycena maculata]